MCNENEQEKMLKSITKQLCELLIISKNMEQVNGCADEVALGRLANDFIAKCEKITCYARNFAIHSFLAPSEMLLSNAAQIQGIKVKRDGEILEIEMPFLLPKKLHKNSKFICDPLYYVLTEIAETIELKVEERAVVCFVHIYDKTDKHVRPRDYDNVEAKRVLDIVALFALRDDGAEFCDIVNSMEYGDENKTCIFVMPERCYFRWKFDRGKRAENGR